MVKAYVNSIASDDVIIDSGDCHSITGVRQPLSLPSPGCTRVTDCGPRFDTIIRTGTCRPTQTEVEAIDIESSSSSGARARHPGF
jgi:hypothetical protein